MFCCNNIFVAFLRSFCVTVQGSEGLKLFSSFNSVYTRYLKGILLKLCILVYNFEIKTICCDFNFEKIYALFDVHAFSPEIMVV